MARPFSHTTLGRILGVGRNDPGSSPSDNYTAYENEVEGVRLRRVQDTSMNAVAARRNAALIYGSSAITPEMTMRNVIEVRNDAGEWESVAGRNREVPDTETQVAFLQNWRDTGKLGTQPLETREAGSNTGGMRPRARPAQIPQSSPVSSPRPMRGPDDAVEEVRRMVTQQSSMIESGSATPTPNPHAGLFSQPPTNPRPDIFTPAVGMQVAPPAQAEQVGMGSSRHMVPIRGVAYAQLPGQNGLIEAGSESRALDVIAARNYQRNF